MFSVTKNKSLKKIILYNKKMKNLLNIQQQQQQQSSKEDGPAIA